MYLRVLVVGTGAGGGDYRLRRLRLLRGQGGCPRPPVWLTRAIMLPSSLGRPSAAEVRNRGSAADALNPDVLDPEDVGCNVVGGDDHLRGEGLVVTVASAVEVRVKPDRVLVGAYGLQGLRRRPGALEARAPPQVDRVPANAFACETPLKRTLADVARAAKATRGVDEAAHGVVGAAARERGRTGREAADVPRVEAEADVPGRRRGGRRNKQNTRYQHRGHECKDLHLPTSLSNK